MPDVEGEDSGGSAISPEWPSTGVADPPTPVSSAPEEPAATTAPVTTSGPPIPSTPAERVQAVLDAIRLSPDGHPYLRDLSPYRATAPGSRGSQETFYTRAETSRIAKALREIVRIEAPVLESVAVRRVGELWGFKRMKSKAAARVAQCFGLARLHFSHEADVWLPKTPYGPRNARSDGLSASYARGPLEQAHGRGMILG